MAVVRSPAIAVRISDYSETSLIAVFFTRDFGLVRALFKGARRKAKAYQSAVDLLVMGELVFYERKSGLNLLKEFAPAEIFPELPNDLERYRAAMACLEFVQLSAVEGEPSEKLFGMFCDALGACARGKHPWNAVYAFLMSGLSETGFAPSLDACTSCEGTKFPPGDRARTAFSFGQGGVLCMKCGTGGRVDMWLTSSALAVLRASRRLKPGEAAVRQFEPTVAREVRSFLRQFCEFTFERRLRMLN